DIRVASDPTDVGHAPINIRGMNVLIKLRGARRIGQIAARAVLAALGFSGRAARVHQKERRFRVLRDRFDGLALIVLEDIIDKIVALGNHRYFGHAPSGEALPDQNFVDVLSFFLSGGYSNVGGAFVVYPFAVAVVTVR